MENLEITLPCGFSTDYRNIKDQPSYFECIICKNHTINKGDCLEMKRNKFVLKQKEVEVRVENLEKIKEKINLAKKDPENVIKESFKSIKHELDLRREVLKKQIDDFYFKIMKDVEEIEEKILIKVETDYQDFDIGPVKIEKDVDIDTKIKCLDCFLIELNEKELLLKPMISNLKKGEDYKLVVPNEHKNVEEIFGKIEKKEIEKEKINSIGSSIIKYEKLNHINKVRISDIKIIEGNKILIAYKQLNKIQVIDINDGSCVKGYFNEYIFSVCILNKEHFAIGSKNKIFIRNINTGEFIKTLEFEENINNFYVKNLKLLSNGRLVSVSYDESTHRYLMKFWNLETGECFLNHHLDSYEFIRIEESNGEIFYGSKNEINKFNIQTKEISKFCSSHSANVNCLKIINKDLIASGSDDKTIKIWNMKTGMCIKTLIGHTVAVEFLEKLKNNLLLSSGKSDPNLRIWNIYFGVCVLILKSELDLRYNKNIFTDDYDLIVIACDKKIEFWRSVK